MKCFDRAVEIDPSSSESWYSKGLALFAQNRFDEAAECFDRTLELTNQKHLPATANASPITKISQAISGLNAPLSSYISSEWSLMGLFYSLTSFIFATVLQNDGSVGQN
jgi:tetratricopeptide (TPR) repeat protein